MVGGAGCVGGQEKEWMGCFLDDLRAFGINADQWTTAAQDEGEWRRTAEQGAGHIMAKWIVAEKAQSKRARAGSLALVDQPPVVARTCIFRAFGLQMPSCMVSFCGVTFVLFCFVFVFMLSSLKPRSFVQSSFDNNMQAPRRPHVFILFEDDVAFSEYVFVPLPLSLCMESTSYVLSFRKWCFFVFVPCDHGLDF